MPSRLPTRTSLQCRPNRPTLLWLVTRPPLNRGDEAAGSPSSITEFGTISIALEDMAALASATSHLYPTTLGRHALLTGLNLWATWKLGVVCPFRHQRFATDWVCASRGSRRCIPNRSPRTQRTCPTND